MYIKVLFFVLKEEGMGGEKRLGEERGGEGKNRKTASGVHLLPAVTFFAGNPAGN